VSVNYKYIFGPVPSRRLGRSLGVDLVPAKVCSFDCIYCQAGHTTRKTIERAEYVPGADVIAELGDWLAGGAADFITFSGNGEPTLHSRIGEIIGWLKAHAGTPVAVITNGSLLWRPDAQEDVARADVVVPSLDTADPATFKRLNRPEPSLEVETIIEGLVTFTRDFAGEVWLEHFIVPGISAGAVARSRDDNRRISYVHPGFRRRGLARALHSPGDKRRAARAEGACRSRR